ncbi:MAG: NUDIX hydrolase [Anaerolineales bacterium]|jgi:8-oxo-dGTP pyrophosphatase MutT (NUDIX family)
MTSRSSDSHQNSENLSAEELKVIIQKCPQEKIEDPFPWEYITEEPRAAAVLIPFVQEPEGWHILFIRRTQIEGDMHSGQVAFPGGAADPDDDDAIDTAIRETQEEIGVLPHTVNIIGTLGQMRTISNYVITPVVGILEWPALLVPAPSEVSRIFTIPLHWLADPSNRITTQRKLPTTGQTVPVIYFKEYDGETLWGASARMMMALLDTLHLA